MRTLQKTTASLSFVAAVSLLFSATQVVWGATDTWSSSPAGVNWNSTDWTGGNAPPLAGDALVFGASSQTTLNNNLTAGTAIDGIYFTGGNAFTLNGNNVLLSGSGTSNTVGVLNTSGLLQTFGTLSLTLDRGYYTFSSSGGIALNGGVTLNAGGVAYFDANNTSTSLSLDGTTGLISGLEGAGLMYDGNFTPTGLATISGGNIGAYSAFTSLAGGATLAAAVAIPNGNNLNLSSSGSAAFYTNNNKTVNSITVAQVGNVGGTSTTTLTNVGTLTLGQNGGIYVLGNTLGNKACFSLAGGTLTAGTSGPATITFAVNGNNQSNQASCSATIVNNTGGGPVSVIYTGPGSMNFATTTTSTYSGGTYVNQGQLQFGQVQQIGTGSVYIASNASVYFTGTGTITNDFYLSPGNGSPTAQAVANGGALSFVGSGTQTLLGTIHLLGAPVTLGTAGDRISGNLSAAQTAVFAGQITGTGTLDFYANPHADQFNLSNNTVNPNNWQGGLIIEEVLSAPSSARNVILFLGANNQIPSGASAGNVTLYSADATTKNSIVRLDMVGHNATINGLIAAMPPNNFPVQAGNITGSTACTLTLGANGNNNGGPFTFAGVLSDGATVGKALNLVKIGTGTQILGAANTYVGSTTISNGTLALSGNGAIGSSPTINIASAGTLDATATGAGGFTVASTQTVNGIGAISGSTTINGTINPFFGTIGTLANNGNVAFNGGGTYVWDMNNANGTAGADTGWSLLNITGGGTLTINANSGNPFIIKITSLTAGDVAGNAANFVNSGTKSWTIAQSTVPISGFAASAFTLNTSGFSNPLGSGAFSIGLSGDQKSLVLTFTGTPAISTQLVNRTNNAGTTATFTVVANGATPPITFNWLQGSNPLISGGTSASGGAVTITTNSHTSVLTVANVQDADAGGFTVNVSDIPGNSGSSSATLTVIDPPTSPNIAQSLATPAVSGGSIDILTASATGTAPFTYQWFLGTNAISGATGSNLTVNVSGATVGDYTVVISNQAGSATNTLTIAPVSVVPDQIVYEPFNYQTQSPGAAPWTAFGVTNIFNQVTGVGLSWVNSGTAVQPATLSQDMRIEPAYNNPTFSPNGDSYPWPGLAGNSPQEVYCNVNSYMRLPLGTGGSISNGTIYFSVVMHVDQGSSISGVGTDYFCGFGNNSGTTPNTGIYIKTPGDDSYIPGIFKTSAGTGGVSAGVNGQWSTKAYHRGQIVFAIARLTLNPGANNDTFDLWLAPATNSFGASEANLPTPDVTGVGGSAADVGSVDYFYIRDSASTGPISRRYTDLRIGTTWASVTPPSAPTLTLGNVYAPLGTTAVFASQNAGNPVTGGYSWQFNGGSPLSDGPTGHGSSISGSGTATLTISNVQSADLGTYKVTGSNTDPLTSATLTGTASAILTTQPPSLGVVLSSPNVIVFWPTNWIGYLLEQSPSVSPTSWTTNSLPPYGLFGTNSAVAVPASGIQFYRLIKH